MSELQIYRGGVRQVAWQTRDPKIMQVRLRDLGVVFEQFQLANLHPDIYAAQDEVIEGERELLDALMRKHGFAAIDVLSITPEYPRMEKLHQDFQREHVHPHMQARLFLAGRGCFYLRSADEVHAVTCERGDFISLPAQISHWFDMGEQALLLMVRLYASASGWQAIPSGNNMRDEYPGLVDKRAARSV